MAGQDTAPAPTGSPDGQPDAELPAGLPAPPAPAPEGGRPAGGEPVPRAEIQDIAAPPPARGAAAVQSAAVAEAAAPERPARGVAGQAATAIRFLARNGATPASVVLRLEPEELGRLQVSISHPKDGPAAVSLTVERPETLLMLVRDQAQLHRVLDQAGLAGEGRQLSFELARAEIPSTAAPAFGGGTGPGMAGGGDQTMDLRGQQAGAAPPGTGGGFDPGFQHGQPDPRERGGRHTPAGPPPGPDAPRSDHPAPALRAAAGRGGIDITA